MGKIYETLFVQELDAMQLGAVTNEVCPMVTRGDCLETFQARLQGGTARQSSFEETELTDQDGLHSQDTQRELWVISGGLPSGIQLRRKRVAMVKTA